MNPNQNLSPRCGCPGITRRSFLADTGMGFTGIALAAMFFKEGIARGENRAEWRPPVDRTAAT